MAKNPEKKAAYMRAYREANKEKCAASRRAYYEANKEKKAAYQRAYREANKEKCAAYMRAYREANKEKRTAYMRAYMRAYREANKKVTVPAWVPRDLHQEYLDVADVEGEYAAASYMRLRKSEITKSQLARKVAD